jgi:hypothetical protein
MSGRSLTSTGRTGGRAILCTITWTNYFTDWRREMRLQINEDLRLESDQHGWAIQKRGIPTEGKNAGKEYWTNVAFSISVDGCVRLLAELQLRNSEAATLAEAVAGVNRLADEIRVAFDALLPKAKQEIVWTEEQHAHLDEGVERWAKGRKS